MNIASPIQDASRISAFERLDCLIREWALKFAAEERQFPVLIDGTILRRAEYPDAFPHLLMAPAVAANAGKPLDDHNARVTDWYLSPAVCYHAFAEFAGCVLEGDAAITARGHCFRNEALEDLAPGRRQVEFQMRELVFLGRETSIEQLLRRCEVEIGELANNAGLECSWCPANDPFFLPRARGKAMMQRLLATKIELCLPSGLAIASINRHGTFLSERFGISLSDNSPAHTACVAFGLDRWVAHISEPS